MLDVAALVASSLLLAGSATAQNITFVPKGVPAGVAGAKEIPTIGFGTWNLQANTSEAVAQAIVAGYRHFDGATAYLNQKMVGEGIKEGLKRAGLKRSDIWVTSKIWSTRHGSAAKSGIELNLQELGLDYLDLTLMHFPIGNMSGKPEYDIVPTWKEMEKWAGEGPGKLTRYIGVSNFNVTQLDEVLAAATIKPKVHQYERHPYLQDNDFLEYHRKKNLQVTAYAPLGNTNPMYVARANRTAPMLQDSVLSSIAKARGCTVAQVALRWNVDQGVVVHPKTQRIDRMKENLEFMNCRLTQEDHAQIKGIKTHARFWELCMLQLGLPCYRGLQDDPSVS